MTSFQPEDVQIWFPPSLQKRYVDHILRQSEGVGERCIRLTNIQAEHLVRLWGYGYVQDHSLDRKPIEILTCRVSSFCCSHSEAASLLYVGRKVEGSARSAGLMLRKLESMRLMQCKSVKGSYTKISLNIPQTFELPEELNDGSIFPDRFNPRNDAPTVANFLKSLHYHDAKQSQSLGRDLTKMLRGWSKQYPDGLRVLRHAQTQKPVAIVAILPVHPDSESNFDLPPSESLYLPKIQTGEENPIKVAESGNPHCCAAYMCSWHIKPGYWKYEIALHLTKETKLVLQKMQKNYPELSDVYSMILHPHHEDFAIKAGFEIIHSEPNMFQHWIYISLDHFLESNSEDILREFDFELYNRLSFT